jgi:hypothetical protein
MDKTASTFGNDIMSASEMQPGWRSVLLGMFVLFQVVFLPLANLMQFVPRELPAEKGELNIHVQREGTVSNQRWLQEGINGLGSALDRWSELSGQGQVWSLFAPDFGKQSIFPEVQFNAANGQLWRVTIRSKRIPGDPAHYFRWPSSSSRPASYEFLLTSVYWYYTPESLEARPNEWRDAVLGRVREQQRSLQAYFRLQVRLLRMTSKDIPDPDEVILRVRIIPSPEPGSTIARPALTMPLARWFPGKFPDPDFLPVEAYDPVAKQFVQLPAKEGR